MAEAVSRCRGQASLSTVAETAGASKLAVRGLFFALVTATLASQLSKAGTLLPALSYRAATLAAAVAACVAALGPSTKRAADLNALLTAVFAASAVGVGLTATTAITAPSDSPSTRHDYRSRMGPRRGVSIPTILQLLVFAETVPTVNELLDGDAPRIRTALTVGSLAPLLLEAAWACLGLGLITRGDPFEHCWARILPASAPSCSPARPSRRRRSAPYLALKSDVAPTASRPRRAALYATLPAVAVALTSPEVFFKAMDFAGAYPVAITGASSRRWRVSSCGGRRRARGRPAPTRGSSRSLPYPGCSSRRRRRATFDGVFRLLF